MPQSSDSSLFSLSLLPQPRPPLAKFVLSLGTEAVAVLALAWVGVLHPEVLIPPKHEYQTIALAPTPAPVNHQPAPVRVIKPVVEPVPVPVPVAPPVEALHVPAQVVKPKAPRPETPAAPKIDLPLQAMVPQMAPVVPRRLVKTDNFSTGSSAAPTIAQAPQKTQTGGFGDTNGIPARANSTGKPANIAQMGSFDMPSGPGSGNGTGGAKGSRGVIASSGFGNGTAVGDGTGTVNSTRGTVRQAGFGDAEQVAATPIRPKQELMPDLVPADITFKPNPIYTEEARQLRIQGEVLLEVTFQSSGKLHVQRVIRGLGHGLDEAAIRAAEQIRFKPALRGGQPADSTAVLHIVFQLA